MGKMLEKQMLGYIKRYIRKNNISPSIREIQAALGIPSLSTTQKIVESLVTKNLLYKQKGAARGLSIPGDTYDCTINLNVVGDRLYIEVWKGSHIWEAWDTCLEELEEVISKVIEQVTRLLLQKTI